MTSASVEVGSAARNDADLVGVSSASRTPAGLRSHTPISQTASTPGGRDAVPLVVGHVGERRRPRRRARRRRGARRRC